MILEEGMPPIADDEIKPVNAEEITTVTGLGKFKLSWFRLSTYYIY